MPDYQKLYLGLCNDITDVIAKLVVLLQKYEMMYCDMAAETPTTAIKPETNRPTPL